MVLETAVRGGTGIGDIMLRVMEAMSTGIVTMVLLDMDLAMHVSGLLFKLICLGLSMSMAVVVEDATGLSVFTDDVPAAFLV